MLRRNLQHRIAILLLGSILIASCLPASDTSTQGISVSGREEDGLESEAAESAPTLERADVTEYQIITLLPKDAIPSIDYPMFYTAAEADQEYDPDELVMGVEFDGEARAYAITMLSGHEIVNDTVAGRPIAVTW